MEFEKKDIKKILYMQIDRIGDVIRGIPLIKAIRNAFPNAYFAVFSASPAIELLKKNPYIDDLFEYPEADLKQKIKQNVFEGLDLLKNTIYPLMRVLIEKEFDLLINPYYDWGALLSTIIKPKYVLGRTMDKEFNFVTCGEETAKFFYTFSRDLRGLNTIHLSEAMCNVLKDIDINIPKKDRFAEIFTGRNEKIFVNKFFKDENINKQDFKVMFQIGSLNENRKWPLEKFVELADKLYRELKVKIILNGSKTERDTIIKDFEKKCSCNPIISAGRTTVLEAVELIKEMDLVITNDSGPLHIADTFNKKIIALIAIDTGFLYEARPRSKDAVIVLKKNIKDIEVQDVFDTAGDVILGVNKLIYSENKNYGEEGIYQNS